MSWTSRYLPPDGNLWQSSQDHPLDAYFFQIVQPLNLATQEFGQSDDARFALLGFKCDEGVQRDLGRAGAAQGPLAIRRQLAQFPFKAKHVSFYDAGDITCTDHDMEASQVALAKAVTLLLKHRIHPIVIGGSHEAAWGHYQGIAQAYPQEKSLGIINFDAHFDLQIPNRTNSATTAFYQIAKSHEKRNLRFDYNCIGIQDTANTEACFKLAKALQTHVITADDLFQGQQEKCFDFIDRVLDQNEHIYMSLSLDVFSPAYAPGVSTIQPLGLSPWHVIPFIRQMAASHKIMSYDICEYAPLYDIDHRTAKLAASLIYEIIHHHSEHKKTW